ncbi:Naringenin,2-oxoglutarate 3-dioxygenase [Dendrobium catenatum]|uniref:Naringenin,2-oxoglutarate 3-dioxygenase n=1 Tax=Dendrobium catenatum TaxID=906689 RepID=A0A2I0WWC6_9ASPA|nr:Naringenin,2-oxoglutarate 3-dioxygenase [Dendrobium catenatum]
MRSCFAFSSENAKLQSVFFIKMNAIRFLHQNECEGGIRFLHHPSPDPGPVYARIQAELVTAHNEKNILLFEVEYKATVASIKVVDHDVDVELIADMICLAHEFFALPPKEKLCFDMSGWKKGGFRNARSHTQDVTTKIRGSF